MPNIPEQDNTPDNVEQMDDISDSEPSWNCYEDYPLGDIIAEKVREQLLLMGNRSPNSLLKDMKEYGT